MTVRSEAWEELKRQGFRPQLTDRVGKGLTSFGDVELGFALKLAGWKFLIDPRLKLQHYMTEPRLTWGYLRRLMRGAGASNVVLDGYFYVPERCGRGFRDRLRVRYCWWHFLSEARRLIARHSTATLVKACLYELEGKDDIEWSIGRLIGLLRLRPR